MASFFQTVGTQVSVVSPEIHDPEAFQAVIGRGRDVYLTVDVDVLDRTVMSSTGYPADARDAVTLADATRAMQIFLHVLGWGAALPGSSPVPRCPRPREGGA